MPNNKAHGTDEVIPLCRTVKAWGVIPSNQNTAMIQLIWRGKGLRDDDDKYRIHEINQHILQNIGEDHDGAAPVIRKKPQRGMRELQKK